MQNIWATFRYMKFCHQDAFKTSQYGHISVFIIVVAVVVVVVAVVVVVSILKFCILCPAAYDDEAFVAS